MERHGFRYHGVRWALLLLVAVLTHLVFPTPAIVAIPYYAAGETAERTVVAPVSFVVRKTEEEILREGEERAAAIRPVYRFDAQARDSAVAALASFVSLVEAAGPSGPALVMRAGETRSVSLSSDEAQWLSRSEGRKLVTDSLQRFVAGLLSVGVADAGAVRAERSTTIILLRDNRERIMPRSALITFSAFIERSDRAAVPVDDALGQRVFRRIAASFFRPTIVLDVDLTASRRGQLKLGVDSLKYRVEAGEQVVAAGEGVTAEARDKLLELREELRRRPPDKLLGRGLAGALATNVLLLAPFWLMLMLYRRETWAELREMAFLAALFGLVVMVSRAMVDIFPGRPELLPVPLAALLVAMLYNGRIAVVAALTLAVLIGEQWLLRSTPALFFCMVGGTAASMSVRAIRRRLRLYTSIGIVALAYALAAVGTGLSLGWDTREIVVSVLSGYASAIACVSLGMLLLPVAESISDQTTDLTLLELADPSRPLLRRLAVEAPGTWAHSVSMANLCESACAAIGANGLLARVGCYYHDIGKLHAPPLFVENQARGASPHDSLTPKQSATIIREHVVQGMILAQEARLPKPVSAFIPEHHGTSEIRYFLHRANLERPAVPVDLDAFRYPGPRPRSRETAVAMLADSVEAVVRTLVAPTPETVRAAINDMLAQRVASGQLDDAPLTLRDLETVREEFGRVLAGQFHQRIEYPAAAAAVRVFRSSREVSARE
jgi:putative nucleotidyltransferase with HDIG domain